MTTFDSREKALENKYVQDEKVDFVVEARTSKLFGLWAASLLGFVGSDADTYATEVVGANLKEAGFQDILDKVRKDCETKGISVSDHVMEVELQKALNEAKKQIKGA